MRILHTSDWHLGKRLMERERLPEQIQVLDEIVSIAKEGEAEIVLIAGDIYDTYLPPAEAEELFFHTVKRLSESSAVVIISGNHDDGLRLSAAAPLATEQGIYVFGGSNIPHPGTLFGRSVRAREAGKGYVVIENAKGERVYINALPYPTEASLRAERTEESYEGLVAQKIAEGDSGYRFDMPHILLAHLFVSGGTVSESERDISLGGVRSVPVSSLPQEGYVALGHLHKPQRMGETIRYSGSPLQYSFDESPQKEVVLLETEGMKVRVSETVPLTSGKKLYSLEANGIEEAEHLLDRYPDAFLSLTLHLDAPLTRDGIAQLKERNRGLLHISPVVAEREAAPAVVRSAFSDEELFVEFYRSRYDREPDDKLKETFLSLLTEGK